MNRSIMSPAKYIQGRGEIRRLSRYCAELSRNRAYLIGDAFVLNQYGKEISAGFEEAQMFCHIHSFSGECTYQAVQALAEEALREGANIIVGVGGGKALDVAKATAYFASLPLIVAPTVASTDAPCSALSVLYTENGRLDRYLELRSNPDRVIVDSEVIAKAPVRLLVAGMGDALSTFYEARACHRAAEAKGLERTPSTAAYALAKACRDTVLEYGVQAKRDAEEGILSSAVENIIEANIYLSGIGFESGGLAAAHAIHNGLTLLEETRPVMHGEKVAFTTLVQLALESAPLEEVERVLAFCRTVGLPVALSELHLSEDQPERLRLAAEASCEADSPMANMPFSVTAEDVLRAMLQANSWGMKLTSFPG